MPREGLVTAFEADMVLLVRSRALSALAPFYMRVSSLRTENKKKLSEPPPFPPPHKTAFLHATHSLLCWEISKKPIRAQPPLRQTHYPLEKSSEFSRVCQAGVALSGAPGEGHSERSIQNSTSLCDEDVAGRAGKVRS